MHIDRPLRRLLLLPGRAGRGLRGLRVIRGALHPDAAPGGRTAPGGSGVDRGRLRRRRPHLHRRNAAHGGHPGCRGVLRAHQPESALRQGRGVAAGDRDGDRVADAGHRRRPAQPPRRRRGVHALADGALRQRGRARPDDLLRRRSDRLGRRQRELTRISHGKVRLLRERLEVGALVRRTCEDLRSIFDQGGIALRLDLPSEPIWVDADPTRIAQVVGNLLQNASKFTPAGGSVTVSLGVQEGQVEIGVRDTGIGIEPGALEAMFRPFAQEERGLGRTHGGLGLGLALAKGLVELHGGHIEAYSAGVGRGSEFVVALPLRRQRGVALERPRRLRAPPPRREGSHHRRRRRRHRDAPGRARARGSPCPGGPRGGIAGLSVAREARPDVALATSPSPTSTATRSHARRADESLRSTRLVAVTGYAQPEDEERAREAGSTPTLGSRSPSRRCSRCSRRTRSSLSAGGRSPAAPAFGPAARAKQLAVPDGLRRPQPLGVDSGHGRRTGGQCPAGGRLLSLGEWRRRHQPKPGVDPWRGFSSR